jgi:hypothetical protein
MQARAGLGVDIKIFFFTFLEVNMLNILWSTRICKRTFFPVCRMCWYVNTLVYFYLAPYSRQERFRFRKSYDISSIPIVIVKFKCTRKIY